MLTVRVKINIASQTTPQIIPVVQGDTGRSVLFEIADFVIPASATATYYIKKPSGQAVYNAATIDGNTVLADLTAQSIAEVGENPGQVRILKNDEVVTSFDFILDVEPFRGIDAIESTTEMNVFDQAVQQALEKIDGSLDSIVADEFSTSDSYLEGEYVLKDGALYRFTSNHAAGAWSTSDTEAVTIGEALTELAEGGGGGGTTNYNNLSNKPKINNTELSGNKSAADLGLAAAAALAPEYSSSSTYAVGDLVLKDGQLYECNTAISTAEAWNSSHWTSKTVADEFSDLKGDYTDLDGRVTALEQGGGSGLTSDIKQALLQLAAKVAYVDDDGQDYYDDLHDAFYTLVSISAVYTQSGTVYDTDSLDSLKTDLVVTAHYDDQSTETITAYTLSGTLAEGTSTVTVSYKGKTTTFTVVVTASSSYTYYDYVTMTYNAGDTVPSNCGILTDIAMSSDYTLETSVYYGNTSVSSPQNIMGTRNGQGGTKEFGLFCMTSNGKLGYWYGGTDTSNTFNPMVSEQVNTIKVQPVGVSQDYPTYATINVNGTDYNTGSTVTGATWDSWLGIFKYGISASSTSTSTTDKCSGFQIGEIVIKDSSNNTLHDLKPAYDGTYYGFVDTISGTFYYNATYADKYTCGNWS